MFELFSTLPHIDDLDLSKISILGDNILYNDTPLFCVTQLINDNPYIPNSFQQKIQSLFETLNLDYYEGPDSISVYDKQGYKLSDIQNPTLDYIVRNKRHKIIINIVRNDGFRPYMSCVQFLDYESPLNKKLQSLENKLENIERILDIPNNMGSIYGWIEIMKEYLKEDSNSSKCDLNSRIS